MSNGSNGSTQTPLEEILDKRSVPAVSQLPVQLLERLPLKDVLPTSQPNNPENAR